MYKILTILILIVFINENVSAQEKIKYINLDLIIKNTNAGKLILENLENKKNENIKNFKIQEDKIISEEQDLIAKKNILSEEEFKSKLADLKKNLKIYREKKQKKINEFENNKKKLINNFFEQNNTH
jgi:Outer membrane protein (OmpH-like).